MRRSRLSISGLMLVVLTVALALAVEATRRRWRAASSAHLALAESYFRKANEASEKASRLAKSLRSDDAPQIVHEQRRADYWGSLMQKHRGAAERPWLQVEPDPSGPE